MMRNRLLILIGAVLVAAGLHAQPSWVKKATKAVFTLKTFDDKGQLIGSSSGFFIGDDGVAVSAWQPFRGAQRAIVIDAQGKEHAVVSMLGADDTYDVAKFRVEGKKFAALVVGAPQTVGTRLWTMGYRDVRNVVEGPVRKVETVKDNYQYYTLAMRTDVSKTGTPLLNDEGEVVGIVQRPLSEVDTLCYAVGAAYAQSLHITSFSLNDPALKAIGIKSDLPDDVRQASVMLYLASPQMDEARYMQLLDDFIAKFPDEPDGYVTRAQRHAAAHRYAEADRDLQAALKIPAKQDETHYQYSRLVYLKCVYDAEAFADWTLDRALSEVQAARQANPLPLYQHHEGLVRYAQHQYADAYELFMATNQTTLRSAEVFYEAANCQLQMGDSTAYMALLDSCVAQYQKPYLKEVAPYLLARAQALIDHQRYREAVGDLNEYEALMPTGLTAAFYEVRSQAEIAGRMFPLALADLDRAIALNPEETGYLAEKASLQLRVRLFAEAAETARAYLRLKPDAPDAHLMLGIALCQTGQKTEGMAQLKEAERLGHPQAADMVKTYGSAAAHP